MKNKIKKIKFRGGSDATKALIRKLTVNFIREGKLTSTEKRVRVVRSQIEKLLGKAKRNQESDKNMMLRYLADKATIEYLTTKIAPVFKDRNSGYVRIIKLIQRVSDGAEMARLEWTVPILKEETKLEKKTEEKVKVQKAKDKGRGKKSTPIKSGSKVNKVSKTK